MLKLQAGIRIEKKGDLSELKHGHGRWRQMAGLSISQTADLQGFSQPPLGFTDRVPKRENIQSGSCVEEKNVLLYQGS